MVWLPILCDIRWFPLPLSVVYTQDTYAEARCSDGIIEGDSLVEGAGEPWSTENGVDIPPSELQNQEK